MRKRKRSLAPVKLTGVSFYLFYHFTCTVLAHTFFFFFLLLLRCPEKTRRFQFIVRIMLGKKKEKEKKSGLSEALSGEIQPPVAPSVKRSAKPLFLDHSN